MVRVWFFDKKLRRTKYLKVKVSQFAIAINALTRPEPTHFTYFFSQAQLAFHHQSSWCFSLAFWDFFFFFSEAKPVHLALYIGEVLKNGPARLGRSSCCKVTHLLVLDSVKETIAFSSSSKKQLKRQRKLSGRCLHLYMYFYQKKKKVPTLVLQIADWRSPWEGETSLDLTNFSSLSDILQVFSSSEPTKKKRLIWSIKASIYKLFPQFPMFGPWKSSILWDQIWSCFSLSFLFS